MINNKISILLKVSSILSISFFYKVSFGLVAPNAFSPSHSLWPNLDTTQEREFIQPSTERTEEKLLLAGYQPIYKHQCVNFKGCYTNHFYVLGQYRFMCEETRYNITMPCEDVMILSKSYYHPGINETTSYQYICAKNYYCFRGKLEPW